MNRAVLALVSLLSLSAAAGTVRTLDGKTIDGDVHLDQGALFVAPKRGDAVKLDLSQVLKATFRNAEAKPQPAKPAPPQKLGAPWKTQDVGPTGTPGSVAVVEGNKVSVKGAGANVKGTADSFYFVYQELRGDGQIVARLSDLQLVNPDEKAGLMVREKFNERGSKCAFLYFKPQDGSSFAVRADEGAELAGTPAAAGEKPPAWLKLTRQRGVVAAFKSLDGDAWTRVGVPQDLQMDQRVYVGLAVCSRDTNAACVATFETINVQGGVNEDPPPKLANAKNDNRTRVMNPSVVLRSGAVLGNVHVESADDQSIRLVRDGKPLTLATSDVARLVLAPITAQQLAKVPPVGTGVLLARGDFMEGDLSSFSGGRVRMNSIVFGPADLAAGGEALMVVLHDITNSSGQAAWVITTNEGFVYMAKSLRIDRDAFVIDDELTGSVRVRGNSVAEIKAGGARFDLLADLRPERVDAPAGTSALTAVTTPPSATMGGQAYDRPLAAQAGASMQYLLDGRYKMFLARVGVDERLLPTTAVRLIVSVDGRETYHSPPLTSFDEPATVAVPIEGAKGMTIRVETVGDAALPGTAVVADGALIKG